MEQWRRVSYSTQDLGQMQQDALRRVRAMQQQAENRLHQSNTAHQTTGNNSTAPTPPKPVTPPTSPTAPISPYREEEERITPPETQTDKATQAIPFQSQGKESFDPIPPTAPVPPVPPIPPQGIPHQQSNPPPHVFSMPTGTVPPKRSFKETARDFGENLSESFTERVESITTPITKVMDAVGIEQDKLLIIGLLIVLLNEKSDKTLLLALGYLLFT